MITLIELLVMTAIVSALARTLGASKKIAVFLGFLPAILLLSRLAANDGLELGPHGGIFPAWVTVVGALAISLVSSLCAAFVVMRKEAEPNRQRTTRGM
jgi:hypothetical protein